MATKRGVKWELPIGQGYGSNENGKQNGREIKSTSEIVYSDTFEDPTNLYTDTFMTESYSDTFENTSTHPGSRGLFKVSKDQVSSLQTETEPIQTVVTEGITTIIEVDSESELLRTAADITGFDTIKDISDTHPTESYSDTFESADKTRTEFELRTESAVDSQKSYSQTFTQSSRSLADTVDDLDLSYIAPEYDGKSQIDDGDDTDQADYSDTFEPTELTTTQLSQSERSLVEPVYDRKERQAQQNFIDHILNKFKDKELVKERGLQVISPELSEESEDEYLKHYCKKKVKQLRKRVHKSSIDDKSLSEQEISSISTPLLGDTLSDYGLTDSVLERAKLTNVVSAMKKAARRKIHEVENCTECSELKQRLESEEAERNFTESKTKMLKSKIMDMHVENHLLKMNSISMIAELARELPRSSERPEKIMDKLLEPLLGKNVMR